jgi:glycosyltransferase involved in cell wall biosynthesis
MKILLISSTFEGITHGPAKFANLMMKINDIYPEHEIRILTPDIKSSVPHKIYKVKRFMPPRPFGVFWVYTDNFIYYKALMKVREEYDFDVLLFNNAIQSWKTAAKHKKNFLVAGMINDDEYVRRSLFDFELNKKWWIDILRKPLERAACKSLDLVITNSNYLQKIVIEEYCIAPEHITRLYKSVDLTKIDFRNDQQIDIDQEIKILFVKNDFKRGGLENLVKSLSKIKEYKFRLVVMGPMEKDRKKINNYFIGRDNIVLDFKGPTSQEMVFEAMGHCDIFCVPALREALGVANIEALAAGIPVVSSDAGGIPEILSQGAFGWISPKGDVEKLAKSIRQCIENTTLRKQKSTEGRIHVENQFSDKRMLQNIINEFEIILKEH